MNVQEERMPERGRYIVFEGGEHVGKSTQADILARAIGGQLVREPGGTPVGLRIRHILLNPGLQKSPMTEVLLHAAQRAELTETVIRPHLLDETHVVSDRSWISSAAYQGAQGVEMTEIEQINRAAVKELIKPDLIVLLDADPAAVISRSGAPEDYYERLDIHFHRSVRERFLDLGQRLGAVVIDATASIYTVGTAVREAVADRLRI